MIGVAGEQGPKQMDPRSKPFPMTRQADVIVAAVGKRNVLTKDMRIAQSDLAHAPTRFATNARAAARNMIGEGPAARSIKLDLPPFTLIGATTRLGLIAGPLRDRFGIVQRLEFYTPEELTRIVRRSAKILGIDCEPAGAAEIANRSRGTPRIANLARSASLSTHSREVSWQYKVQRTA